jgi:hypothetical protein
LAKDLRLSLQELNSGVYCELSCSSSYPNFATLRILARKTRQIP